MLFHNYNVLSLFHLYYMTKKEYGYKSQKKVHYYSRSEMRINCKKIFIYIASGEQKWYNLGSDGKMKRYKNKDKGETVHGD